MKTFSKFILVLAMFLSLVQVTSAQTSPTNLGGPATFDPGFDDGSVQEPVTAVANRDGQTFQQIVADLVIKTADFSIIFLVGLTVLVFMYGLMKYMFKGASSDTARTEGRKLMLWGLIGIFVMVSVWGLVGILSATIGHESKKIPQFDEAPYGRFDDGRPRTQDQQTFDNTVNAVRKTARERYQEFMQRLRQLPENAARNGRGFIDFMQGLPGRLRGSEPAQPVQPSDSTPTSPTQSQPFL